MIPCMSTLYPVPCTLYPVPCTLYPVYPKPKPHRVAHNGARFEPIAVYDGVGVGGQRFEGRRAQRLVPQQLGIVGVVYERAVGPRTHMQADTSSRMQEGYNYIR